MINFSKSSIVKVNKKVVNQLELSVLGCWGGYPKAGKQAPAIC